MVEEIVWVPICKECNQVRDGPQSNRRRTSTDIEQWMSLKSFLRLYRLARDRYKLTHTYCPRCSEQLMRGRPRR